MACPFAPVLEQERERVCTSVCLCLFVCVRMCLCLFVSVSVSVCLCGVKSTLSVQPTLLGLVTTRSLRQC